MSDMGVVVAATRPLYALPKHPASYKWNVLCACWGNRKSGAGGRWRKVTLAATSNVRPARAFGWRDCDGKKQGDGGNSVGALIDDGG